MSRVGLPSCRHLCCPTLPTHLPAQTPSRRPLTAELNLRWQILQEMNCFFLSGLGTPKVWLITAFCTGSIWRGARGEKRTQLAKSLRWEDSEGEKTAFKEPVPHLPVWWGSPAHLTQSHCAVQMILGMGDCFNVLYRGLKECWPGMLGLLFVPYELRMCPRILPMLPGYTLHGNNGVLARTLSFRGVCWP